MGISAVKGVAELHIDFMYWLLLITDWFTCAGVFCNRNWNFRGFWFHWNQINYLIIKKPFTVLDENVDAVEKDVMVGEKFDVCFVAVSDGRLVGVPRM